MLKSTHGTRNVFAISRLMSWRSLVLLLALASVLSLYSQQATHFHPTVKYAQLYPKGQVEKPGIVVQFTPSLHIFSAFSVSYSTLNTLSELPLLQSTPSLRPPSRGPPKLIANL